MWSVMNEGCGHSVLEGVVSYKWGVWSVSNELCSWWVTSLWLAF